MSLPKKIYCLWLGDVEMTQQRRRCLNILRQSVCMPVELVTDGTLEDYIDPDHPLHEGYEYLSATHKADYLRTYLMHHYGGGYVDIKQSFHSWIPYWTALNMQEDKWIQGYREIGEEGVAVSRDYTPSQQTELKKNWIHLLGNGGYICRPGTPFTEEWLSTLHHKMDEYLPALKEHPARTQRDCLGKKWINGTVSEYPVPWTGILGAIFHPLCLKYKDRLLYELPPPLFYDYF